MRQPDTIPRKRALLAACAAAALWLAAATGARAGAAEPRAEPADAARTADTAAPVAADPAKPIALKPHRVVYRTTFKGMGAGDLTLTLARDGDGWRYETTVAPSFLARIVISSASIERGWFTLTADGVRPSRYLLDDGSADRSKDIEYVYDWTRNRVTGIARGTPVDHELAPGLLDPMAIRAAVLVDLQAGREPREYRMLDGQEVKDYVYHRVGTARVHTALGELDTVIYVSDRKNSDGRGKSWKYWYAPALGYLPVRLEQRQGDDARLIFAIRSQTGY